MVFVEKYEPTENEVVLAQAAVVAMAVMGEKMAQAGISKSDINNATEEAFDVATNALRRLKMYSSIALLTAVAEDFAKSFPNGINGEYVRRKDG